ncbi:MAG: hypothetical protein IT436_13705 [Phycisphaerales bacterium]|nr:hypothetical protein [Phycisphaerales bacterium]
MAASLLIALLACIALGLALAWAGLRGRRINDHPICRSCGFDLIGVYPAAVTCPECGAGLKRPRAIRDGARRRLWPVLATGALLAAVPASVIGTIAFGLLTGAQLNDYKPLRLLMWEAARARGPRETELVRELIDRVENQPMELTTGTTVSELALRANADRSGPRSPAWPDLIEAAHEHSVLSNMDHQKYLNEAVELEVTARPKVRAGDPVPILIRTKDIRIGQKTQAIATIFIDEARLDDRPVARWLPAHEVHGWSQQVLAGTEQLIAEVPLAGPGTPNPAAGDAEIRLPVSPELVAGPTAVPRAELIGTADLPPGPHMLKVSLYIDSTTPPSQDYFGHGIQPRYTASVGARRVEFTLPVEFVPPGQPIIRAVPRSDDLDQVFEPMLRPGQVMLARARARPSTVSVHFILGRIPVEIAYDVFIRQGDREVPIGSFTSGIINSASPDLDPWLAAVPGARGESLERVVAGEVPDLKPGPVDVILRPNPDFAARTVDIQAIYGGDFVFRDVPVRPWLER